MTDTIPVKREDLEEWSKIMEDIDFRNIPYHRDQNALMFVMVGLQKYLKKEDGK